MNHEIEFLSTKQVRHQLDNRTEAMIKWDVATVRFPIARQLEWSSKRSTRTSNTGTGSGRSLWYKVTSRLLAESEDLER